MEPAAKTAKKPTETKKVEEVKEKKVRPEAGVYPICRLPLNKEEKALWRRLIVVLEAAYPSLVQTPIVLSRPRRPSAESSSSTLTTTAA